VPEDQREPDQHLQRDIGAHAVYQTLTETQFRAKPQGGDGWPEQGGGGHEGKAYLPWS
jgi:hypothetical protein